MKLKLNITYLNTALLIAIVALMVFNAAEKANITTNIQLAADGNAFIYNTYCPKQNYELKEEV